ncbi:MAG: tRNA lysidine(34) synthetase TilS [Xanthomonadales bacterium]|nr:tRNA lysidine(34) synthetase TilS [Xanthomonadales bacterium]
MLTPEDLLPWLDRLQARRLWVAFSGGLDSTALLLALASLRKHRDIDLRAVHANHGVHPDADEWARHCKRLCESLSVYLEQIGPPHSPLPPDSPEAQLRHWRYGAFETLLDIGDVLCTAHHRADQAETVLLALMRGSGPAGLAAMPEVRSLGKGRLARPLLDWPRSDLVALVRDAGVTWIDDPGNAGTDPDRNYLRHEVIPRLRQRWPAANTALATSARHCAQSQAVLDERLDASLSRHSPVRGLLHWSPLAGEAHRERLLLRRWLSRSDVAPLPRARLEAFLTQLATAREDRHPRLEWAGHSLQRHREHLWLDSPAFDEPVGPLILAPEPNGRTRGASRAETPDLLTTGLAPAGAAFAGLTLRRRAPGDRLRIGRNARSRPLKQWLSTSLLPPWQRDAVPVLCRDSDVLAIADAVLDDDLAAHLSAAGRGLRWSPPDPGLGWAWERCRPGLLRVE